MQITKVNDKVWRCKMYKETEGEKLCYVARRYSFLCSPRRASPAARPPGNADRKECIITVATEAPFESIFGKA